MSTSPMRTLFGDHVDQWLYALDSSTHELRIIDPKLEGLLRAELHASTTAFAKGIIDASFAIPNGNGLHITYVLLDACLATTAFLSINGNRHARHTIDGGVDARIELRNHLPKATAFAAGANREKVLLGPGSQPNRIDLVPSYEVDEASLATFSQMLNGLIGTYHPTHALGYLEHAPSEEDAS